MIRKLLALLWLRFQILFNNKVLLAQLLMPVLMLVMYDRFLNPDGDLSHFMLYNILTLAFSMASGLMVSATIAEEKEKKLFKTLALSGVNRVIYLLSVLFLPVMTAAINIIVFPKLVAVDFGEQLVTYYLVSGLTAFVVIMLYLLLGSLAETQSQSQTYTLIPMLVISFFPMIAQLNETVSKIMNYTFLKLYNDFFNVADFKLNVSDVSISLIWLFVLATLCVLVTKQREKAS